MSDFTFKQIDKNEYETFMEGKSLNIFFKIPDGCKIEDYNISKTTETPSVMGRPSKTAYFEFTKAPDKDAVSTISPKAGVEYTSLVCDKIQMNNSSSSGSLIKFIASNSSEAEAKTKIPIYLENIKLDSHACLEVNLSNDLSKKANIPIEFKNTDFNKNAYLDFSYRSELEVEGRDYKDYANIYYNLTNVEVKEGATFKVDMQATWKKAFSNLDYAEGMEFFLNMTNCVINGECELHGFVPNLNNVVLDNANLTCNYPLMEANNSVIRDKVELFNIKGVNNSELNKAVVDSSEPIKIDSEIISSNYIPDYVAYLAEKDNSSKNSKIDVKDIEIL